MRTRVYVCARVCIHLYAFCGDLDHVVRVCVNPTTPSLDFFNEGSTLLKRFTERCHCAYCVRETEP